MKAIIDKLILNSKASQLACIEIHNKPIFPFRYETCIILNINSWELLFKAFILKNYPEVKVILDDGRTKPFEECLSFISSCLGRDFLLLNENVQKLYEFRCNVIHFYQEEIDILLFSILSKNVLLYHEFLLNHFEIDISSETNLVLLPIGFKKPTSPIDFLSNESRIAKSSESVRNFIKSIVKSTEIIAENGIEDSILYSFKMSLINENRIKSADIIAAVTSDKSKAALTVESIIDKFIMVNNDTDQGVKKVKIEEESLFKSIYTESHDDLIQKCKALFSDFKNNNKFIEILKGLKNNPQFHKVRYLNLRNPKGGQKHYYSSKIYEELAKHYIPK
jgi:hypothetical protein